MHNWTRNYSHDTSSFTEKGYEFIPQESTHQITLMGKFERNDRLFLAAVTGLKVFDCEIIRVTDEDWIVRDINTQATLIDFGSLEGFSYSWQEALVNAVPMLIGVIEPKLIVENVLFCTGCDTVREIDGIMVSECDCDKSESELIAICADDFDSAVHTLIASNETTTIYKAHDEAWHLANKFSLTIHSDSPDCLIQNVYESRQENGDEIHGAWRS